MQFLYGMFFMHLCKQSSKWKGAGTKLNSSSFVLTYCYRSYSFVTIYLCFKAAKPVSLITETNRVCFRIVYCLYL